MPAEDAVRISVTAQQWKAERLFLVHVSRCDRLNLLIGQISTSWPAAHAVKLNLEHGVRHRVQVASSQRLVLLRRVSFLACCFGFFGA
eukprot:s258_g24.t1